MKTCGKYIRQYLYNTKLKVRNNIRHNDNMDLTKTYNSKELTIEVGTALNTDNASDFKREILDEMGNFDSLILDFKNLEYISSNLIEILINLKKKLESQNIPFKIIHVNENIKSILKAASIDEILNITC